MSTWWPSWLQGITSLPIPTFGLSLPSDIQRRFLSYILRRSLGRFLKPGQLDVQQIDSQIGSGYVQINDLEVDHEAINGMLTGLPLRLRHGSVSSVIARVPWPNPLTSTLGVAVKSVHLVMEVTDAPTEEAGPDLSDSIASMANSFVHDELDRKEEAELRKSIRPTTTSRTRIPDANIPGGFDSIPLDVPHPEEGADAEETSIFSALAERILSRFVFDADDTTISLEKPNIARFTLTVSKVRYGDEDGEGSAAGGNPTSPGQPERSHLPPSEGRSLIVSGVTVSTTSLRPVTAEPGSSPIFQEQGSPTLESSSSAPSPVSSRKTTADDLRTTQWSPSASDSDMDDEAAMMMSQSLLFPHGPGMLAASTASSMYESAISDIAPALRRTSPDVSSTSTRWSPAAALSQPRLEDDSSGSPFLSEKPAIERVGDVVFALVTEPIRIMLRKSAAPSNFEDGPGPRGDDIHAEAPAESTVVPRRRKLHVSVSVGVLALALRARHVRDISELSETLTRFRTSSLASEKAGPGQTVAMPVELTLRIRGVVLLLLPASLKGRAESSPLLSEFFTRPLVPPSLPCTYTRAFVDDISGSFSIREQPSTRGNKDNTASSMSLEVGDVSLFSFHDMSSSTPHALPILITDHNLPSQYSFQPAQPPVPTLGGPSPYPQLPTFDVSDWTDPGQRRDSAKLGFWRMRPPAASQKRSGLAVAGLGLSTSPPTTSISGIGVLSNLHGGSAERAAVISFAETVNVKMAPIHVFIDLGVLEDRTASESRDSGLLTFLEECFQRETPSPSSAPLLSTSHNDPRLDRQSKRASRAQTTPRVRLADLPSEAGIPDEREALRRQVVRDLDLGYDYAQDDPSRASSGEGDKVEINSKDSTGVRVRSPMIRVQVRCSPAVGQISRSGALVLDAHDLVFCIGEPGPGAVDRFSASSRNAWSFVWSRALASYAPPGLKLATGFVSLGASAASTDVPTPESSLRDAPLTSSNCARIAGGLSRTRAGGEKFVVEAVMPTLESVLSKPAIDGLQFLADDVSQLMARLHGPELAQLKTEVSSRDQSMIGSRFFARYGSRSGSVSNVASMPSTDASTSETVIKVEVAEAQVRLLLPRETRANAVHPFDIFATKIDALVELKPEGKDETVVTAGIATTHVQDTRDADTYCSRPLVTSSTERGESSKSSIKIRFMSRTIPETTAKESSLKATVSDLSCNLSSELQWASDIGTFFKAPPGVFEAVAPSERTQIAVKVINSSAQLFGSSKPACAVLQVGEFSLCTDLADESSGSTLTIGLPDAVLLLIDDYLSEEDALPSAKQQQDAPLDGAARWTARGFARFAELESLQATLFTSTDGDGGDSRIAVNQGSIRLHLCADTSGALGALISDLSKNNATLDKEVHAPIRRREPTRISEDAHSRGGVMAALEEEQDFRQIVPEVGPTPDMMDDDLPSNVEYIDDSYGTAGGFRALDDLEDEEFAVTGPVTLGESDNLTVLAGGETIRLLTSEPLHFEEHHFDTLPPETSDLYVPLGKTDLRVRIQECDFTVLLYDGYDWRGTRKTIEEETRAMRRRLAKIRQMLASGQAFDPSVEDTSALLYNSVYVGLEDDIEGMDRDALIAVIDEELEDDFEVASQSSWQTLVPTTATKVGTSKPGTKRWRLTRSRNPSIEFSLMGLALAFDQYKLDEPFASRTLASVRDVQILDHIKTSTWKMFLTDLHTDLRGIVRESDSDMVRLEIRNVRPVLGNPAEEARLRAKILPLRLHVDQDALDFMKKFFSFQDASAPPPGEANTSTDDTYFQHVEVFPIDLKLDYKPRRVDYRALREGKTIELMNFFHFDGSEMTLRHIRLHGVTGWARLGDMLNDLWTPDVKATQLVDVISGVAPIRSVVNVGSGVADLVLLPIAQYKRDGRIVRGLQKGAKAFMKSTGMEALKLGARLATGTQVILEQAEDLLGAQFKETITAETVHIEPLTVEEEDDAAEGSEDAHDLYSRYAEQPLDAKQGIQSAYTSLRRNLNTAAQTILAVPMEVYERSGNEGPVRAVVRAVPIAVLKPMIGASEALSMTLLGIHNNFDSNAQQQAEAKYKRKA